MAKAIALAHGLPITGVNHLEGHIYAQWLVDGGVDGSALAVHLTIRRGDEIAFEGESSTANMNRRLDELAGYLGRHNDFPHGAVLLTGTGIVPGDDFTLQDGDTVSVEIENIGVLVNPVRTLSE